MSLFLAHSGHKMSSLSVMNPFPTMDVLQEEQRKQSLCQWRPSKEMKRVPPMPGRREERGGGKERRRGQQPEGGARKVNSGYICIIHIDQG